MNQKLLEFVPKQVRDKLGGSDSVCLLSGRDVFVPLKDEKIIVMACNPRISHAIPGIMKASQELDAVVAFELTMTEGGIDGGYTGQTPSSFVHTLIDYAHQCHFTKPFIIHADHITVKDDSEEEFENARLLIDAQIEAGYTSFAIDASFNPLPANIDIVARLAAPVRELGFGLELELGERIADQGKPALTTPSEAEAFLSGTRERGISPHLLAINNGSKRGNYLEGEVVRIDLARTRKIHEVASSLGVSGLVQHGITGTPLHLVGKLADYGIRKGNIGTLWQNVAHAGLPLDLVDSMRRWSRDNDRDIKYATRVFKAEIDAIPAANRLQILEMAYREAKEFLLAFHAKGSATKLAESLGRAG